MRKCNYKEYSENSEKSGFPLRGSDKECSSVTIVLNISAAHFAEWLIPFSRPVELVFEPYAERNGFEYECDLFENRLDRLYSEDIAKRSEHRVHVSYISVT